MTPEQTVALSSLGQAFKDFEAQILDVNALIQKVKETYDAIKEPEQKLGI